MKFLLATAVLASLASAQTEAKVAIAMQPEVKLLGASILLRDIAEVRAEDAGLQRRLDEVRVAPRPAYGANRVLARGEIIRLLLAEGVAADELEVGGSPQTVVRALTTTLRPEDVMTIAEPALRAALTATPNEDLEFEPTKKLSALRVPPGRLGMELRARYDTYRSNDRLATINVEVLVDQEVWRTLPVQFRLRRFGTALSVTRSIRRGETLGPHNVAQKRIEIDPANDNRITSMEELESQVAARDLRIGQTLKLRDLAQPAVVFRSDPVELISQRGRIQVVVRAIALQDGAVGDRIQVRNLATNKPIQAVVHAPGVVRIPTVAGGRR